MRRAVSAALLFFVAATLVKVVADAASAPPAPEEAPAGRPVAYFFHTDKRCTSCRNMEAWSRETLGDRVAWRVVNLDEPGNERYAEEYGLLWTSSVVLVKDGEAYDLGEVWQRIGDEEDFKAYVAAEARAFLGEQP